MKKALFCLAVLCLALTLAAQAPAETLPEPFVGYFDQVAYIREKSQGVSDALTHIPAQTAIELTPVNEFFAAATYNGVSGYVYYVDAKRMPEETPVEGRTVYLKENKYLYDTPLMGAKVVTTMQAETPMDVVAEVGKYVHVKTGTLEGYLYRRDVTELTGFDAAPTNKEIFVASPRELRVWPLRHAEAVATLEPGRIYRADATSRGFFRVTANGATGWIAQDETQSFKADARTARVALMTPGTTLYERPDKAFLTSPYAGETRLALISAENGGFYRLSDSGSYVWQDDVTTFALSRITLRRLYVGADTPLTMQPSAKGEAAGAALSAGELYAAQYETGGFLLVDADGVLGFLPKDSATAAEIQADERMNRTAALLTADAVLYGEDGRRVKLSEGEKLFLTDMGDVFYRCETGSGTGYVLRQAVRIVGADAPLEPYSIAAGQDAVLMDFPDAALAQTLRVIPAGETVEVSAFNRCYLLVSCGGVTGYARQDGLLTDESQGLPASEDVPRYQLALDKSTYMAYIFLLDEEDCPCAVVMSAKVGIGKSSTPTPSGAFTLGEKERWHTFTYSYTPHTTKYVKGRFIHGIPCRTRTEDAKIGYMEKAGGITGGCLRCPMDFARFVYMNCPSYQTEIVIVSGGLAVPDKLVTPEELAERIASPSEL